MNFQKVMFRRKPTISPYAIGFVNASLCLSAGMHITKLNYHCHIICFLLAERTSLRTTAFKSDSKCNYTKHSIKKHKNEQKIKQPTMR